MWDAMNGNNGGGYTDNPDTHDQGGRLGWVISQKMKDG